LSQAYRNLGKTQEARYAVQKYQTLRQAAEQADAKEAEDWRKLNAANAAASAGKGQP
jgi:hypothetical protein